MHIFRIYATSNNLKTSKFFCKQYFFPLKNYNFSSMMINQEAFLISSFGPGPFSIFLFLFSHNLKIPQCLRRPWTYRPEEWRGVASMSHPNLRAGGLAGGTEAEIGGHRREIPITRSESPSGGQPLPANLKSCLKDSKAWRRTHLFQTYCHEVFTY
jgi:hypothetical protein